MLRVVCESALSGLRVTPRSLPEAPWRPEVCGVHFARTVHSSSNRQHKCHETEQIRTYSLIDAKVTGGLETGPGIDGAYRQHLALVRIAGAGAWLTAPSC